MKHWPVISGWLAGLVGLIATGAGPVSPALAAEPPGFDAPSLEFFESKVRPILAGRCQSCHGPEKQKGGLRLDARSTLLEGGDSGPAAVAGEPDESLLVEAVRYTDALQMPPKSRLPADEVETLTRWVAQGLPWTPAAGGEGKPEAIAAPDAFDLEGRKASHWAWKRVEDPAPPAVTRSDWPAGPIDRFILGPLERAGLAPAPGADRRVLIRRLSFDLTGLPPTPAEVAAFLGDARPDAYARLVDRLLDSPRFGERWARHWLDLVRYAETRGHEFDPLIPNAWRYRDYVVRALNADVPYDQFLTEHLAGDLVDPPRRDPATGANESVLGTGFWFLGEEVHSPVDIRQDETDRMDNRLDVMTKTFLGLTVACARCHDHKFDAIPQTDYYALTGFLISSTYRQVRYASMDAERDAAVGLRSLKAAEGPRIYRQAAGALRPGLDNLPADLLAAARRLAEGPASDDEEGWAKALRLALDDREEPLHPLARLAADRPADFNGALERLLGPAATDGAPAGLVVDFGATGDLETWQNGLAFGLRPAAPGDLRFADGPTGVRPGVHDRAAAAFEGGSPRLTPLPTDHRDHGKLGEWDRPGQTLRTPEFRLNSGRLWYLVRGGGRAYASMNAHLIVAGPLHAAVLKEWKPDAGESRWRWVRHDLPAYKGHRLHVEFSPADGGELGVARVVDSETEPSPVPLTPPAVAETIRADAPADLDGLARSYAGLIRGAARRLEEGSVDEAPGLAPLADWLLARAELLAGPGAAETYLAAAGSVLDARRALAASVPSASPTAPAILDGNGFDENLLIRGSSKTPGPAVPRRFLEALSGPSPVSVGSGSGRLELAARVLDPSNPFTPRVMANRVWHHLFGRGVVASVDNFGVLGEPPTHPELLDHLATEFVRNGWSVKKLIRSVVLSRAYRMGSAPDPVADAADPGNALWHRRELRRLEAEPLRDAILAVSGSLVEEVGGPGVPVHLTAFLQGRGRPAKSGPLDGGRRRSLYQEVRRNFLSPLMLAFDAPIPFTTMGRRNVSNVPAQALILMNDPFVAGQARHWADRVLAGTGSPEEGVRAFYLEAFSRPPDARELAEALEFVGGSPSGPDRDAWADLAHVLFNAKEFVFVE